MRKSFKITDKVIFHVDNKSFNEFMDAWRLIEFYRDFNTKCCFWVEYVES